MAAVSNNSEISVCVTGAGGFIGAHIVRQLLEKGYTVKGTVRDATNEKRTSWLRKLAEGTNGRLELFSADLTVPGSYDEVVEGCQYVCHVAAAVMFKAKDPYKEIVDPAVKGTENILSSVMKAGCAKRVILTSSIVALGQTNSVGDRPYNESDWNEKATIQEPYMLGKTLSEKYAWKVYNEQKDDTWRFELVTMLPGFVMGPLYAKIHARSSPGIVQQMLDGTMSMAPNASWNIVDVRDVAYCHVAAMEDENAKGRYILSRTKPYHSMELAAFLKKDFGNYKLPSAIAPNFLIYILALFHPTLSLNFVRRHMLIKPSEYDGTRAETEFKFEYMDPEKSLVDTAKSIIALELVKPPKK